MAENVIDLVHRLSYRSDTAGLNNVTQALEKQFRQLQLLATQQQRLQRLYDNTSDTTKRERLRALMDRQRRSMDLLTQSTERAVLSDRNLQRAMQAEIGIIGTLETRLNLLRQARTRATSEDSIRDYDRQIRTVQSQLNRLNTTPGGGPGFKDQVLQGLGLGAGFGVAGIVGSGLSAIKDFVKESSALAKEAEGVSRAFERLDKPELLGNLQRATKGTVSDLELMKNAVQFSNFGLPVDKLATALAFAQRRARETGVSVDYLVQSIVTGVGRQSPLILDNLGISTKRVAAEFEKTGNFAEAAFNIIAEETKKSGASLDTYADKVDRMSSSWDNFKVKAGKNINAFLSGAVELGSFAFGTSADRIAIKAAGDIQAQLQEEATVTKEAHNRMLFDYASYLRAYEGATKEGKTAILNQVEIFEGRIREAEKQSMDKGQSNAAAYYQGLISMFQRFRVDIAVTPAKTLEQMNVSELEAEQKRNTEFIEGYSVQDLKDASKLAQRNAYIERNKRIEEDIKQIRGTEEKVKKVRVKSHNSEYSLEKDLSKRIADLRYQQNALLLKDEADTTEKLRKETDARIEKDNEELDAQIANARKRKILTAQAAADFETIRELMAKNAEIDFKSRNDELLRMGKSKTAGYQIDSYKFDLSADQSRSGILGVNSLFNSRALIEKERVIAVAEENKRFDDLKEVYRKEGRAIEDIEYEHNNRLQLIDLQFFQKNAQAHLSHLEALKKQVDEYATQELARINAGSATEAEGLRGQRNSGAVSNTRYQRLRGLVELRRQVSVAKAEVSKAEKDLQNAQAAQSGLQGQLDDPKLSATRRPVVQKEFDEAKRQANEAQVLLTQARDGLDETNKSLLSAGQQQLLNGVSYYELFSNAAVEAYSQINAAAQQANEREIAIRQQRVTEAQKLAERGNVDALRIEQERLDKAQAMQEEYARRQQAINSGLAVSNSLVAVAKSAAEGGPFAFATIAATVSALIAGYALVKNLGAGFAEGGYTGAGGKHEPAGVVHRGEVVFSQRDVAAFGGWKQLDDFRKGLHRSMPVTPSAVMASGSEFATRKELNGMRGELREIKDAINGLDMSASFKVDQDGVAAMVINKQTKDRKRFRH
jgi:hypothetical protein